MRVAMRFIILRFMRGCAAKQYKSVCGGGVTRGYIESIEREGQMRPVIVYFEAVKIAIGPLRGSVFVYTYTYVAGAYSSTSGHFLNNNNNNTSRIRPSEY